MKLLGTFIVGGASIIAIGVFPIQTMGVLLVLGFGALVVGAVKEQTGSKS